MFYGDMLVSALLFVTGVHGWGSDPVLIWTQKTHMWARMRGVHAAPHTWPPSHTQLNVGSVPNRDRLWRAVTYNAVTRHVIWYDAVQQTIYRQPADACLVRRSYEDLELVYRGKGSDITALSVDWNTNAVYWADDAYKRIGVSASVTPVSTDVYRILHNTDINRPVGLVVDPAKGFLYWLDVGSRSIDRSTLQGDARTRLLQGDEVGHEADDLVLDALEGVLYWSVSGRGVHRLPTIGGGSQHVVQFSTHAISGLAVYQDYLFVGDRESYTLEAYSKSGAHVASHAIDAEPYSMVIIETHTQPHTPCGCEQLCLGGPDGVACECSPSYLLNTDGTSCEADSVKPAFIYSRGKSVWMAEVIIDQVSGEIERVNESVLVRDTSRVQALSAHVSRGLVYYGDMDWREIRRLELDGRLTRVITVNTRHNLGVTVDWVSELVYWCDADLGTIMVSQLDGRFHRVLLDKLNSPRGLAVDPVHGYVFWSSGADNVGIWRSKSSGGPPSLLVALDYPAQGVVADARRQRLYWSVPDTREVHTSFYDGSLHRVVMQAASPDLYDVSIYKDYMGMTTSRDQLKFLDVRAGTQMNTIVYQPSTDIAPISDTYDVVTYHSYAQPRHNNACAYYNGGCDQLCHSVGNTVVCSCAIGFKTDGSSCVSDLVSEDFLLFVDPYHKQIYQLAINSTKQMQGMILPRQDFPIGFDIDPMSGHIIWIDTEKLHLASSHARGGELQVLWRFPEGAELKHVVVDSVARRVYVSDIKGMRIFTLPLDVTNSQGALQVNVVSQAQGPPGALAVDTLNSVLYWSDPVRVYSMRTDGTARRDLANTAATAITVLNGAYPNETVVFWAEGVGGRITKYTPLTASLSTVYEDPSRNIISLAAYHTTLYFTEWREKSIFALNLVTGSVVAASPPISARITYLRAYKGHILPAAAAALSWEMYVGLGVLALLVLVFLLACLICMAARRSRTPKNDSHIYANDDCDDYTPHKASDVSTGFDNESFSTGGHDGRLFDSSAHLSHQAPQDFVTHTGAGNGHAADTGHPAMLVLPPVGAARKITQKKGRELPAPADNPTFEMTDQRKGTMVAKLARRLRKGISSIRLSREDRNEHVDYWSRETVVNNAEPEATPNAQSRKSDKRPRMPLRPQLHAPACGFAPASHITPAQVKATFSKSRAAKFITPQK